MRKKGRSINEQLVSFEVVNLHGKRWRLEDVAISMLGCELYKMINQKLPSRSGARLSVQYESSPLIWRKTLMQQGIPAGSATLSCVYVPVNLHAAWKYLQGHAVDD